MDVIWFCSVAMFLAYNVYGHQAPEFPGKQHRPLPRPPRSAGTTEFEPSEDQRRLIVGMNRLTLQAYDFLRKLHPGDNMLFSPLGMFQVLSVLLHGMGEDAAQSTMAAMNLPRLNPAKFHNFLEIIRLTLLDMHDNNTDYTLFMNKHVYLDEKIKPDAKYENLLAHLSHTEFEQLDFRNTFPYVAEKVNHRMRKLSGGKVDKLLQDIDANNNSRLLVVNGNFFTSPWQHRFRKERRVIDFQPAEGKSYETETMYLEGAVYYSMDPRINGIMLHLPFAGGRLRFVAIKPGHEDHTLEKLEDVLIKYLTLDRLAPKRPGKVKAKVFLPYFTLQGDVDLKHLFSELKMNNFMSPHKADFSKMGGRKGDVYLTGARQKSVITLVSEGKDDPPAPMKTLYDKPDPMNLIYDRPYMFLVIDSITDTIVYIGKIEKAPPKKIILNLKAKDEL